MFAMHRQAAAVLVLVLLAAWHFARVQPNGVEVEILDSDTNKPMPGVVVAARWYAGDLICLHGDCERAEAAAAEVRTGADGVAKLSAWRWRQPWFVTRGDPRLFVHKTGYVVGTTAKTRNRTQYFLLRPQNNQAGLNEWQEMLAELGNDHRIGGTDPSRLPMLSAELRRTLAAVER
jgi:hypothetical protein